ncbi:MAG: hypothetical protein JW836_16410 [Deltaproteobacteria bacterium]|nr:hypothetical protein [Deltaproteobacteria bacterium]
MHLRSGIEPDGKALKPEMGTPQGGPLSSLPANLMLDNLDRELEHQGHRFVLYADDIQHRLVYEVIENENIVKAIRMWTHYE